MNLIQDQKQKQGEKVVQNRHQALARISDAISRFAESHQGRNPSLVQVGIVLFDVAFPDKFYPHKVGSIGDVCIFPRPDICGDWAIVIPKPKEANDASA